jgi:hypothetical protein
MMGLKEISDFINNEKNSKNIAITSLAIIIGSSIFIGRQYEKLSNKIENGNYKRNAIIQETLNITQRYQDKERIYQKIIIEQFGKEAVYRDIINGIISSMQNYKEKKQPTPAIKNLLEEI